MAITTTDSALLRLLQLSSAALPVGGYAFSSGLESAVEHGWVKDVDSTRHWLADQLAYSVARLDIPVLLRQLAALEQGDMECCQYWNDFALAARETGELRLTDSAMGLALLRLLTQLGVAPLTLQRPGFSGAFALASQHWSIEPRLAAHGYAWAWLENQVAAATKLVPLGQSAAQRLLGDLLGQIPAAIDAAEELDDASVGASLPGLALVSLWHENQYSRLFRS